MLHSIYYYAIQPYNNVNVWYIYFIVYNIHDK